MNNTKYIFLFIILIVVSCNKGKALLDIKGKDNPTINYADSASYKIITLETIDESLITSQDKILINDSVISIMDYEKKRIILFNHDGAYRAKIDKFGRGQYEYNDIGDYILYKDKIYLLDYLKRIIFIYNYDGECLGFNIMNDYVGMSFNKINDDDYVFYQHFENDKSNNSEIVKTDVRGNIKDKFLSREKTQIYPIKSKGYFFNNSKGIYFIPINDDKIYRLSDNNIIEKMYDFGIKNQMKKENTSDKVYKYSYFTDLYICDDGLFVCSNSQDDQLFDVIGNLNNDSIRLSNDLIFKGAYKNYLITTISDYDKFKSSGLEKYELTIESNPAIVLIKSSAVIF